MKQAILLLFISVQISVLYSQELTLLFLGDIMGHEAQIASALCDDGVTYDYSETFRYIEPYFRSADIVIGNLEVTLAGPPYKGYPQFSSPDALATALKEAGVGVLVTANNHSCDRGQKGIERTIQVLDNHYFVRTGTFSDSLDMLKNHPQLIDYKGIKLALLNYTYGTNGLPITAPNLINLIDREKIKKDLHNTKELHPDIIMVYIHWGNEYVTSPTKEQQALAELLFANGTDIIIGSHPHVIQPMHFINDGSNKNRILVYSLGNFISNQRRELTDGGAMVRIDLVKNGAETIIKDAEHLLTWVHIPVIGNKKQYYILPASVWSEQGVPHHLPPGWEGMNSYLKKARAVMLHNQDFPEAKEEWSLK